MNAYPLALTLLAIAPALAQSKPQFDVASIKQNTTCQGRKEKDPIPHPGALTIPCITLKELVQLSYVMFANGGARNPEKIDIVGGPTWMDSEYFDLAAKSDGAPSTGWLVRCSSRSSKSGSTSRFTAPRRKHRSTC
jgi:hypothetical protein